MNRVGLGGNAAGFDDGAVSRSMGFAGDWGEVRFGDVVDLFGELGGDLDLAVDDLVGDEVGELTAT